MLAAGALSSGEIAGRFALSPPAISQHLKTLKEARLVSVRADRQRRIYALNPEGVEEVSDWVDAHPGLLEPAPGCAGRSLEKGCSHEQG